MIGGDTKVMLPGTNYKRIVTTYDEDWNAIKTEYEISNPVVPSELPTDQNDNCIKGDSETEYRISVYTPSQYEE